MKMKTFNAALFCFCLCSIIYGCTKFDSPSGNLTVIVSDEFWLPVKGLEIYV